MKNKQEMNNVDIQFIKTKQKRKNNVVRVPFYDELQNSSEHSGIAMATLLNFAWQNYKETKHYKSLINKYF